MLVEITDDEALMIHWLARDNREQLERIKRETPLLYFPEVQDDRLAVTNSLLAKFPRDSAADKPKEKPCSP